MPFADLLTVELAAAAATGFVASAVCGFTGFGLNLAMAPVLAALFSPVEAIPVVVAMGLMASGRMLGDAWPLIDRREVSILGAAAILAAPVGAWVLATADQDLTRRAIAAFVIVFSLILLAGWRYRGPRNAAIHAGVGAIGGFLNASVGVGGPPVVLHQLARAGDPAVGRANLVGFFVIVGVFDRLALARSVLLAPFVLVGVRIGMRGFNPANAHLYRRVALGFLLCVSIAIVTIG